MATKDTPTGLLARVANFVRSPVADVPPQLGAAAGEQGELGKLAIKRMVERKAHNDAVRQREFSQLRKLREVSPSALSEMAARASFYQDSSGFPESETRASTLKKIDEIEAQMSRQWWNGQQRKLGEPAPTAPPSPNASTPSATSVARAPALATGSSLSSTSAAESQIDTRLAFAPTMPTKLEAAMPQLPISAAQDKAWSAKSRAKLSMPVGVASFEPTDYSDFSCSNMVSVEMGQVSSDPVIEDAAIRFANSDDAGAELVLTLALKGDAADPSAKAVWTTALLDLYRSTGQVALYERLAQVQAQRSPTVARWQSPVVLDKLAVAELQASVTTGGSFHRLDWRLLENITPDAALALAAVMRQWCDQVLSLQFDNLDSLDAQLRANTPLGDREVAQFWWQLRLNVLRVLGSREEFELVSMDYCVTYDISPPTWQDARCQRVLALSTGTGGLDWRDDLNQASTLADPLTERTPFVDANASRMELSGELLGTGAAGLKPLQQVLQAKGDVLITCDALVRVDFSAAGSILNWVASAQASGKKIEFARLPHLVAAFFNLIGINEHARVTARSN